MLSFRDAFTKAGINDPPLSGRRLAGRYGVHPPISLNGLAELANIESKSWDSGPITFSDGTALGGNCNVVMNSKGDWTFSGHMHDSGFDSYDYTLAIVMMTPSGIGYTVTHSGHTEGTSASILGSPKRDDNWTTSGNNPSIRDNWGQVVSAILEWHIVSQDLLGQALSDMAQQVAEQTIKDLASKGIVTGAMLLIALA